jgi:Ni/Co efflux regulator RcnB
MKKLISIVVAAAFAALSVSAIAASHAGAGMDKKKEEVKAKQGGSVTAADKKSPVTTATDKPKKETKGAMPKNTGKRKDEKERMDKK